MRRSGVGALGASSRANSVRFDESANQNHFSHSSRTSVDFLSRTSSALGGGLQLSERSASGGGRASSAHSMRSATSGGQANSLNLDTSNFGTPGDESPPSTNLLAPGLLLLGCVPAIIRCWMNTNFKHNALLYAAVCTGSYKSYLHLSLIRKLGFEDNIVASLDEDDVASSSALRTVELPVYFPEAVPHPSSSRSGSPRGAPSLPTLTVNFSVVEDTETDGTSKAIQIFLGSDVLRAHNADILFSSNSLSLFDDERTKLRIPLVRPEDEEAFRSIRTTSSSVNARPPSAETVVQREIAAPMPYQNGTTASSSVGTTSPPPSLQGPKYRPPGASAVVEPPPTPTAAGAPPSITSEDALPRQQQSSRPALSLLSNTSDTPSRPTATASATTSTSPAIWGSWRAATAATPTSSTPSSGNVSMDGPVPYQRKEAGIKVLKPKILATTRTPSSAGGGVESPAAAAAATGMGRSRFFDEGRRRSEVEVLPPADRGKLKTGANPVGGASAFSWLQGK